MMKNKWMTLLTMLVVFAPLQAEDGCEDDSACEYTPFRLLPASFYFGGLGGVNFQESSKQTVLSFYEEPLEVKASWNPGYLVGGLLGYRFCNGWQLETEVSYRNNTIHQFYVNGEGVDISGYNSSISFLLNSYYNFFSVSKFTPYIGLGTGYSIGRYKVAGDVSGVNFTVEGKDYGLPFQAIGGISYLMQWNTELAIEYRFFWLHSDFNDHSVALNLKYFFLTEKF